MSHITAEQRYTISVMKQQNHSQTAIALVIGKHKSVVCRELKRNCDMRNKTYKHDLAQKKYEAGLASKPKKIKLTVSVSEYIKEKLALKYSPEQIAGSAKKEGVACVSHERIYQYIWADKKKKGNSIFIYEHKVNGIENGVLVKINGELSRTRHLFQNVQPLLKNVQDLEI